MIPETIPFTKLTAGGNDFICLDNTTGRFDDLLQSPQLSRFVRSLCRRGLSIGADGLIFAGQLGNGDGVDICARFMEPDGSEAELCGNGTACFTYWVVQAGMVAGPEVDILTAAGAATGRVGTPDPRRVRVCVPDPRDVRFDLQLDIKGEPWTLDYVVTGVPHAIGYVTDLARLDVPHWGPGIRHHPHFAPRGTNANFVQVLDEGRIAIRTFEFGVEAETLACGTGASASAILAALRHEWPETYRTGDTPVRVHVQGGEVLNVWFVCHNGRDVTDVCLETGVRAIHDGVIRPELIRELLDGVEPAPLGAGGTTNGYRGTGD